MSEILQEINIPFHLEGNILKGNVYENTWNRKARKSLKRKRDDQEEQEFGVAKSKDTLELSIKDKQLSFQFEMAFPTQIEGRNLTIEIYWINGRENTIDLFDQFSSHLRSKMLQKFKIIN